MTTPNEQTVVPYREVPGTEMPTASLAVPEDHRRAQLGRYAGSMRNAAGNGVAAVRRTTQRHNVLAIVALGLVAFSPLTVGILAPVGAILGHLSLRQIRKNTSQTGRGMARAAVIIGWSLTFMAPCLVLLGGLGAAVGLLSGILHIIGFFL
ncbi:DUF4190 domain-containing protein [Micromonospora sonneratiae]|uniref:DUF4190 domain-containing protein n=1 Tax=Micromonospora sonneratiae TaxID=1184706 RepID=A0ABW3YAC8_9ACTN